MAAATQTDQAAPGRTGPSLVVQLAILLVLTGAAASVGWISGGVLSTEEPPAGAETASHAAPAGHDKAEGGHDVAPVSETVIPLAGITTNLAAPSDVWLRLELALVVDTPQPPELIETVHQDILAFVRTVKLHQIDGPSGFRHFKADLEERAAIRSEGHVKQVLVRTMLVE